MIERMPTTSKSRRARSVAQPAERFGADYYRRFYLNPATAVVTPREMRARATLIAAVLEQAQIPMRRILDAGCGVGLMQRAFAQVLPKARYTGLEASPYLCRRYGWVQGSIVDYWQPRSVDLIVCYDVLQYLDDKEAAAAIVNMARLTHGALYISALTRRDWAENCNKSRTDRAVRMRDGAWYRRRLKRYFDYLGFGLWLRKGVCAILWEMERN